MQCLQHNKNTHLRSVNNTTWYHTHTVCSVGKERSSNRRLGCFFLWKRRWTKGCRNYCEKHFLEKTWQTSKIGDCFSKGNSLVYFGNYLASKHLHFEFSNWATESYLRVILTKLTPSITVRAVSRPISLHPYCSHTEWEMQLTFMFIGSLHHFDQMKSVYVSSNEWEKVFVLVLSFAQCLYIYSTQRRHAYR